MKTSSNKPKSTHSSSILCGTILTLTLCLGAILSSHTVSAEGGNTNTDIVDQINITVPVSCTMTGTGQNTHNAEINNGQYNSNIGTTTLKAFCNDNEGFSIYAVGYTDNEIGKNVLTSSTLGPTHDIVTGTAISGNTSNWAMKLATVSDPIPTYPIIIMGSTDDTEKQEGASDYSSFQQVPSEYTKVAYRTASTDIGVSAEGSTLTSTYQVYINQTQAAGTYVGQVKYTMVHPHSIPAPHSTMLDTGQVVSAKMKTLAAGSTKTYNAKTSDIKAIRMAESLPDGFVASEANTVSSATSRHPIYIFFDDTDDAGIMYFYAGDYQVVMNPDSSHLFRSNLALSDISGLATWDSSQVTNMSCILLDSVISLTDLNALSGWDVSNVENLQAAFMVNASTFDSGYRSSLSDISALTSWNTSNVNNLSYFLSGSTSLTSLAGLANWDTSKVENMRNAFYNNTSLTNTSELSGWDTSKTTDMYASFYGCTSLADISSLEAWDTGKVENMSHLFRNNSSLTDISALASWDTSSVTSMQSMFDGDHSLTRVPLLTNWDTSKVTDMSFMFKDNYSLTTINVSNWNTTNVATMHALFNVESQNGNRSQLTEIIGLENWDVSNVTDMTTMFYGANRMTDYNIANWNVSKVQSFNHMFTDNYSLQSLDLSKWDVQSVKTMFDMFDDNRSLTTIGDVSKWNTVSLIDAAGFLNGASSFVGDNGTLDLSGWKTSNLKVIGEAFRATQLSVIDLSGWDFSSITNDLWEGAGSGIFYETGNSYEDRQAFGRMFQNTPNLATVYISQNGLNTYNAAVSNGANTSTMWTGSSISSFTVK